MRRAGSAALDLAYVACGRMEAFWEFNLNPWDTAAGILLVEEAGGRVTDFAGGQFRLASDEILASNGLIHEELIGFFDDMFAGRGLSPIPTPEEFARARAERAKASRWLRTQPVPLWLVPWFPWSIVPMVPGPCFSVPAWQNASRGNGSQDAGAVCYYQRREVQCGP